MSSTNTAIAWTDATWNPVTGCAKVSPGCAHCYAEAFAHRQMGPWRGRAFTTVLCHEDRIEQPLHWRKPRKVFVNSMSDLFHPDVPDAFLDRVFAVMALCPQHTFQILTKRAARMRDYIASRPPDTVYPTMAVIRSETGEGHYRFEWPLPNVWLGVSVENQHFADERIAELVNTPAAVRFLSCEPLLENLNLRMDGHFTRDFIHWVIVGGESGPKARPCDVAWIRSIVQQCQAAGVACFVKQLGADAKTPLGGRFEFRHPKGGDPAEWPADLRVREYPR